MDSMGKNRLGSQRCYLAGPIDHAQDDGVGWQGFLRFRNQIGELPIFRPEEAQQPALGFRDPGFQWILSS